MSLFLSCLMVVYIINRGEGVKEHELVWGLVFPSLQPWYGFSIPMVFYHRFDMFLETHTAPTSLLLWQNFLNTTIFSGNPNGSFRSPI